MEMKVFNSLTRREEILAPIAENTVRLYTCGPTVYTEQWLVTAARNGDFTARELLYRIQRSAAGSSY